jgi:hypothetical protein
MTTTPEEQESRVDKLTRAIGEALNYTAYEPILLSRMEEFFSPEPAELVTTKDEEKELNRRMGRLSEKLGGPPQIVIVEREQPLDTYDTYASAALKEILYSFRRCRRSICRTQVCLIGSEFYRSHPEVLEPKPEPDVLKGMQEAMCEMFWEHAETSYIRLASFWDRVGQLLDFVFFNIRQYERDGFSSVMDRIRANYVRLSPDLASSASWTHLWDYCKSEGQEGLKWLVSRRNLLIHSVHLQALVADKGNEIFNSAYNHLDEAARRKLKPETPKLELESLHNHLDAAAVLFRAVLGLCELGVNVKQEQKWALPSS